MEALESAVLGFTGPDMINAALGICALGVSLYAMWQATAGQRNALRLELRRKVEQTLPLVTSVEERCKQGAPEWHAFLAAIGMFQSGRRQQAEDFFAKLLAQAGDTRTALEAIATKIPASKGESLNVLAVWL